MFNTKPETIFLDTDSKNFTTTQSVNVILSPSLYWVKKVSVALKYVREIQPLLSSLFEEILPAGEYSYFAYKEQEDFFIFAYEDAKILELLQAKGIEASQIHKVYFAQSEFSDMQEAIAIDAQKSMYLKDTMVLLLPTMATGLSQDLDIQTMSLSTHAIRLQQFSHIVSTKTLYTFLAISMLFVSLTLVEYFVLQDKQAAYTERTEKLITKHSLKSTMLQNRAILKEERSIHARQTKLREAIASVLAQPLAKKHKLISLELREKSLVLRYKGIKKEEEKAILSYLQSKDFLVSIRQERTRLVVELAL